MYIGIIFSDYLHYCCSNHKRFFSLCRSEFPRRAAVVNYIADGVFSDSEEPLLSGVPVIPPGQRLEGQFFPLVYDPAWVV